MDNAGGDAKFWVVEDQYGGMLSYSKETPQHLQSIGNTPRKEVSVPRSSLNQLLANHEGPIDLVVLDLEGAEIDALQGFDLRRFRPRVLMLEDNTAGKDPVLNNFMQQHTDYRRAGRLAVNEIYIRADQPDIFEQLK